MLGHLVTKGVFTEPEPGGFAMNGAGRDLRQPFFDLDGIGGRFAGAWGTPPTFERTGRPGYAERFGRACWDDLAATPRFARSSTS